jgi:hypothetical protein
MNRKWVAFVLLAAAAVLLLTVGLHVERHRAIRKQIKLADAAIANLVDANMTPEAGAADLTARERLDELSAEDDLNGEERAAVNALGEYLSAVESVMGSSSIETTKLRVDIASAAAKKADAAMASFR